MNSDGRYCSGLQSRSTTLYYTSCTVRLRCAWCSLNLWLIVILISLQSCACRVKDSRATVLFDGIYYSMRGFDIKERLPLRWLPRRFEGNILSIFTSHINAASSRSWRLLNSFDDLKSEVRASEPRFDYFTSLWKAGLFEPYQMWKGDPERSRRRGQLV